MSTDNEHRLPHGDILVVEDNPSSLKFLSDILTKAGYRVRPAGDGELALRSVRAKLPDLILLDIKLPGINGVEVCRRLKADPATWDLPVIFISALGETDLKVKALEAGGIDYVTKPVEPSEVLARISSHLKMHRLQHRLAVQSEELIAEIKERKGVEEALRENEEKYRALYNNAPLSYQSLNEDGCFLDVNPAWLQTLGYEREEVIGKWYGDFLHPDWRPHFEKNFPEFKRRGYVHDVQFKIKHKDGHFLDILFEGCIGYNPDGSFRQTYCVFKDITERKQAEEALRKSEERYRSLFEDNPIETIVVDKRARITMYNKAKRTSGGSQPRIGDVMYKDYAAGHIIDMHKELMECIQLKKSKDFTDQSYNNRFLDIRMFAFGEGVIITAIDRTKQKNLEAKLQQAQRIKSIGVLAGGIAHDFNNLLMGMQGRVSLMQIGRDASHPDSEHLKGIEENVKSAADLTKQLLGFAKGGKYEVKATNLNEIVNKSSDMFGRIKKEIKIYRKAQKEIWTVEVDQEQIGQVLLNLYINAWQAMAGTGEIYLETENVTLDENYVKPYEVALGRYVKISVTDTGIGMDKETQQRMFDPFFTTKEMGRGTGMGLASAYGIIKNHAGVIDVYSEKGKGTTFNIYLPVTDMEFIAQSAESERLSEILRGTETVLLVDDEEMIIKIGKELLKTLGYTVLLANSGREAIETYKKNKDKIDMVLLDMIMHEMGGGETYDRLREINPDIKVLLSSGYSINGLAKTILAKGCDGFIQKPFRLKDLSQKLREILDTK